MVETLPGEVSVATAASLLGVSPKRLHQLAGSGFVVIHRRGFTTLQSSVSGYLKSLREGGRSGAASAALARGHEAKAALIRAATERRRSALTDRAETEQVIRAITAAAISRLRAARAEGLPPATAAALASEITAATSRIAAAAEAACEALQAGTTDLLGAHDA